MEQDYPDQKPKKQTPSKHVEYKREDSMTFWIGQQVHISQAEREDGDWKQMPSDLDWDV